MCDLPAKSQVLGLSAVADNCSICTDYTMKFPTIADSRVNISCNKLKTVEIKFGGTFVTGSYCFIASCDERVPSDISYEFLWIVKSRIGFMCYKKKKIIKSFTYYAAPGSSRHSLHPIRGTQFLKNITETFKSKFLQQGRPNIGGPQL